MIRYTNARLLYFTANNGVVRETHPANLSTIYRSLKTTDLGNLFAVDSVGLYMGARRIFCRWGQTVAWTKVVCCCTRVLVHFLVN